MTAEQAKSEVKLSRAQEVENIVFGMGALATLLPGLFWLINVWQGQFALWKAQNRPGVFIPKWPVTISLFVTFAVPGAILRGLNAYAIRHHMICQQWVVESGTVGRRVDLWVPWGQWQRCDSILYHAQDGFVVMSMPGELREYNFQPYGERTVKRQAQSTKRKATRLGRTYR